MSFTSFTNHRRGALALLSAAFLALSLGTALAQPAPPAPAPAEPAVPAPAAPAAGEPAAIDQASVDRGRLLYRDRAVCVFCHGWDGKGSLVEGEPPAPPLVTTPIEGEFLVETIACGRINATMPRHLRESWSARYPCYGGMTSADLQPGEMPPNPRGAFLTMEQIQDVANFVEAVFRNKEMTLENCVAWFGRPDAPQCAQYR
ncbi:MAG: cytochrome c [Bauldia sp.]|nr:cytochrome c [Bauldia sp.]